MPLQAHAAMRGTNDMAVVSDISPYATAKQIALVSHQAVVV